MINLIFKVYDKFRNEYLEWRKISSGRTANYTFANKDGSYRIGWSATEYPKRYTMCVSFGQKDKQGTILFSGDRVLTDDNELGEIRMDNHYGRLIVKYAGKYKLIETSKIVKVGDVFHKYKVADTID